MRFTLIIGVSYSCSALHEAALRRTDMTLNQQLNCQYRSGLLNNWAMK